MTLEEFAGLLTKAKPKQFKPGPGYSACCPAHEDKSPSFAVWEAEGWLHFKCQTGCTEAEILHALNLTEEDRRIQPREKEPAQRNPEYIYKSAEGQTIFRKVRFNKPEGKRFAIQAYQNGTWEKNAHSLNGERYTLYNLPAVKKAIQEGRTVYLNEGEKACDLMTLRGMVGTCQPFGASETADKWHKDITAQLKGAHLVIVADRDAVGEGYAKNVAEKVSVVVRSLRVVQSKTANPKDDAYDHLNAGFTEEDWIERHDLYQPPKRRTLVKASTIPAEPVKWLMRGRIPFGMLTLVAGDPGQGKSVLCRSLTAMATHGSGHPLWHLAVEEKSTVIWLTKEESIKHATRPNLETNGADLERVLFPNPDDDGDPEIQELLFNTTGLADLEAWFQETGARVLVIDPIMGYLEANLDANSNMSVRHVLQKLISLCERYSVALLGIVHLNKNSHGSPLQRVAGAGAWVQLARAVLFVGCDPDDKTVKAVEEVKHSLATQLPPISYGINEEGLLSWLSECGLTAERMCEVRSFSKQGSKTREDECKEWLEGELGFGAHLKDALIARGEEKGFSQAMIYRAADRVPMSKRSQPTGSRGRGPAWWASVTYDWEKHVWPDPFE